MTAPKTYWTADSHIGHRNIAGPSISKWTDGYRNFDTLEEHDKVVMDELLATEPGSRLVIAGDFVPFKGAEEVRKYVRTLFFHYSSLIFLKGNHDDFIDYKWVKNSREGETDIYGGTDYVTFESDYITWRTQIIAVHNGKKIIAGHHPLEDFRGYDYHFHGHWHDDGFKQGKLIPNRFDVGIDTAYRLTGRYRPLTTEEVIQFIEEQNNFTKLV